MMTLPKNNIPDNTNISFIQNTKANLISLFKQTIQVFIGLILMLLLTGGNPPVFIITLSVIIGIIFVALSQIEKIENISIKASTFQLLKDFFSDFKFEETSPSKTLIVTTKTVKIDNFVYSISSIISVSVLDISPQYRPISFMKILFLFYLIALIISSFLAHINIFISMFLAIISMFLAIISIFLANIKYWWIRERREKQYALNIEFSNGKTEFIYSKNKAFLELIQNRIYRAINHQSSIGKYMFNLQEETVISQ